MLSSNLIWGWLACVRRGPKKPLSPAKIPGKSGVEMSGTGISRFKKWFLSLNSPNSQFLGPSGSSETSVSFARKNGRRMR